MPARIDHRGRRRSPAKARGERPALIVCAVAALTVPALSSARATQAPTVVEAEPETAKSAEAQAIEELDLQTLLNTPVDVWTPSKTPQKTHEAPAIITTVTREQIAVWGHRSLAEVLDHLLGFYVVDDHSTPNVAVRGTSGGLYSDSSVIKVLIDDHPVSFAPTGGHWLGPELVPLTAVERIEVIRGPASALYGADAFLALINIKTRRGGDVDGATAWLAGGVSGKHFASDADVSLGTQRGAVEAVVAFRRARADLSGLVLPEPQPQRRVPRYNLGKTTTSGQDQISTAALATLTITPSPRRSFGAFAYYSAKERGDELGSFSRLANGFDAHDTFSENRLAEWQVRGGADYKQSIGETFRLTLRGDYFNAGTSDRNRQEIGNDYYYVRRRLRSWGGGLEAHLEWTPEGPFALAAGASLLLDRERLASRIAVAKRPIGDVGRGEILPSASVYQPRKTFMNNAAYLQANLRGYEGRLGLTGGLRYDHHNVYGGQISRRLGVVGSPLPTLHAKLLHGSAFQAPSPFLLYAVPVAAGDVVGNQELRPQYVNTFEFQLAYEPFASVSLSSALAYNLIDDKSEFIPQGVNLVARNLTRTATLSWESKLELKHRDWLNAFVSLELSRTRLRTGQEGYIGSVIGNQGGAYPNLMLHSGLAAQLPHVARLALLGSYIGDRRPSGTNIFLNSGAYTLPAYFLFDATITTDPFRILRHPEQELSFSLSGKNLLGATGPAPGFSGIDFPLAPRTFLLQMNLGL